MSHGQPLDLHRETVIKDWVDYNGHMNVAFYVLIFDHATDTLLDYIGLDDAHRGATGDSVFVVEAHVTYEQEAMEGDALRVTTQVLDSDAKRIHIIHSMYVGDDDIVVATNEVMILSVNLNTRKTAAFAGPVSERLQTLKSEHAVIPRPPQAGRTIGIRRG